MKNNFPKIISIALLVFPQSLPQVTTKFLMVYRIYGLDTRIF